MIADDKILLGSAPTAVAAIVSRENTIALLSISPMRKNAVYFSKKSNRLPMSLLNFQFSSSLDWLKCLINSCLYRKMLFCKNRQKNFGLGVFLFFG